MQSLLFTGATGFLGSNILPLLKQGYAVTTLGRSAGNDIRADLSIEIPPIGHFDIVLHACGKAHVVPKTEAEKREFFEVNYHGTVNLCKALENAGLPRAFIFISTVGVYQCQEGEMLSEVHPLGGKSPYSASKIMAERFLTEWCAKNNVTLTILRPALIVGRNAKGSLGAMVNGISRGRYLNIAGGKARKSLVMAEDIARLVPIVADKGGIYNICDSYHPTYGELSALIASQMQKPAPLSIPLGLAKVLAKLGDCLGDRFPFNTYRLKRMTATLTYDNAKARRELGWEPLDVMKNYKVQDI